MLGIFIIIVRYKQLAENDITEHPHFSIVFIFNTDKIFNGFLKQSLPI
jgi:hypothetical protein